MFEFLNQRAAKRRQAAENARETYNRLIRLAASGTLSDEDNDALSAAAQALGLDDAAMTRDARALADHATATKLAAGWDKIQAAVEATATKLEAYRAETDRITLDRNQRDEDLVDRVRQKLNERDAAEEARKRIRELTHEHWQLFGAEDPAVAASKRHLIYTFGGRSDHPDDLAYDYIPFVNLLSNPHGHGDLSRFEFVPTPGQTPAELQSMLDTALAWQRGEIPQPGYLVEDADNRPFRLVSTHAIGIIVRYRPAMQAILNEPSPQFDPHARTWLLHPGQKQRDLDRMVERLKKAFDHHPAVVAQKRADEQREADRRTASSDDRELRRAQADAQRRQQRLDAALQ